MGRLGTYQAEVKVSGLWLRPEVEEDIFVDIEWTVEDEGVYYNDHNSGEAKMYPSYGTQVTKLISAYGAESGKDYSCHLSNSLNFDFLDHLADCLNERYEC